MSQKLESYLETVSIAFQKKLERALTKSTKKYPLYNKVAEKLMEKIGPKSMGKMLVADYDKVIKTLRELSNWWENEFEQYQEIIEAGLERVIEGAKEDVAEQKSEEDDEEYEADDIEESELDPQILYSWWGEEWSHNIEDKHWIANLISRKIKYSGGTKDTFSLQDVRYKGLEGAVEDVFVMPYKDEGLDVVESVMDIIKLFMSEDNTKKTIKWVFDPSEYATLRLNL